MKQGTAWLALGLGGFCLSWASLLVKFCALPPLAVASWRLWLASGMLACWSSARQPGPLGPRPLVVAGALLAVHFASWIASLGCLPVYLSVSLVTTSPLWVALGSWKLFGEAPRPFALGLAFTGALLLSARSLQDDRAVTGEGIALALVGALSMAAYLLWARHHTPHSGQLSYAVRVYALAAALLTVTALAVGTPLWGYAPRQWGFLLLLALVPQLFGHTLLLFAVRAGSANWAALSILLEPVGSVLLALLLLHEHLGPGQWLGLILTLMGLGGLARGQQSKSGHSGDSLSQGEKRAI